jgi:uncharacterized membrane protein
MSIRVYSGPHASDRRARGRLVRAVPIALAAATVLAQIIWVLADDRFLWTHIVVTTFFLASLSHAAVHRGWSWTAAFAAITLIFGYGIEWLGTTTGLPFGEYEYASTIAGRDVLSLGAVPVIVPMAWTMMAYPSLLVAIRLAGKRSRSMVALIGALALTAWDFFLDPQMVAEGWWTWTDPSLHLPGLPDIPLQNFLGWLLGTALLMILLSWLPRRRADSRVPFVLYLWTWLGGIIMNAFWLDRPSVAAWGGIAMGLIAVPLVWRVLNSND